MTDHDKKLIRNSTAEFLIFTRQAGEQSIKTHRGMPVLQDCNGCSGFSAVRMGTWITALTTGSYPGSK